MPEDKVRLLEEIKLASNHGGKLAFVGDGINDAPVIALADVGVAMGALGSDAAIETADVVLMTDSPLKMVEAVKIARQTRRIVWQTDYGAIDKAYFCGLRNDGDGIHVGSSLCRHGSVPCRRGQFNACAEGKVAVIKLCGYNQ